MNGTKPNVYSRGSLLLLCSQSLLAGTMGAASNANDWSGLYLGTKIGAVFSQYNTSTTTYSGPLFDPAQATAINNAGKQHIDTSGFSQGLELGYNWQLKQFLFGLGVDIQSLSSNGATNSGAVPYLDGSSNQFVITSYGNNNWLFTARPRLGLFTNNWLFYVTGGLSLTFLQSDFIFSDAFGVLESQKVSQAKAGYAAGAGIETKLSEQVSFKAEYVYSQFASTNAHQMNQLNVPADQLFSNAVNLDDNLVTLGLNYYFDNKNAKALSSSTLFKLDDWESSVGARLFLSSGVVGAPQPLFNTSSVGNRLASRLIYSELDAVSEETFARFEHASGVFLKGYMGAGSITSGQLNDEDFPALAAYSNTLSNALGNLSYATVDLGYSFLKTPLAKTGVFIGYNYNAQNIKVYNCQQLAGDLVCESSNELAGFLGISEDDHFHSFRVGLSSQAFLSNQLILNSEVAYIPVTSFEGLDSHNARQLLGPEKASSGDGAMLEASLDYQLNPSWTVGLGGRYWMWNTHNGSLLFDFLGDSEEIAEPAHFNTTRYGGFLQLSYHQEPFEHPDLNLIQQDWHGIFIGGHLGGAWGLNNWSDPFNATEGAPGFMNFARFGDRISPKGPLGGGSLTINWQTGRLVYGLGSSISVSDLRGENTLFSGLGGINGQAKVNYLARIVGRLGTSFHNALLYLDLGSAVLNTQYNLNANTGVLTQGQESQTSNAWGMTGGVGIEYAFTPHWSSNVEYNYIDLGNRVIPFSAIPMISNYSITASQSMNVFKLGVNYKIDNVIK